MDDTARYYLGFSFVDGIGPNRLDRLIAQCGSIEAAWLASSDDMRAAGLDGRTRNTFVQVRGTLDLEHKLKQIAHAGVSLITRDSPEYPGLLLNIPSAPPLIYVRGHLLPNDTLTVAVVGTRSPTLYGRELAEQIVSELAKAGVTIISGLAIGIDQIAHSAALRAGGRTIAVLPCGVDMVYPDRHQSLAKQICDTGALVSEFSFGTRPLPQLFPVRNRLISGLARAVLIVEARPGSGALITAEYALEQGRDVLAVPGPVYNLTSEGPHRLIRNGAGLVTSARDVLEALELEYVAQPVERAALPEEGDERRVLALLSREPQHIDELSQSSCLPVQQISSILTLLELKGYVHQVGAQEYVIS